MFLLFLFAITTLVAVNESLEKLQPQVDLEIDSSRIRDGLIHCKCSPTDSVPNKGAVDFINKTLPNLQHPQGSKSGYTVHATKIMLRSNKNATLVALTNSKLKECEKIYSHIDCINADNVLRRLFKYSLCTYDYVTGMNLTPEAGGLRTVRTCSANGKVGNSSATIKLNEGCVAINHLKGYPQLYTRNIWTEMYCYKQDVCATANHAIIFRGVYTSLKVVCANPIHINSCSRKYGWVNNLRVSRRYEQNLVKVSDDISITPWDYRFPKIAVWISQTIMIHRRTIILVLPSLMFWFHYRHKNPF